MGMVTVGVASPSSISLRVFVDALPQCPDVDVVVVAKVLPLMNRHSDMMKRVSLKAPAMMKKVARTRQTMATVDSILIMTGKGAAMDDVGKIRMMGKEKSDEERRARRGHAIYPGR
jgi:hypothetical protein